MSNKKNILPKNDSVVDFTSRLPAQIIHDILYRLSNNKERAQTCVLSKRWMEHYASRPIMIFHERDFQKSNNFFMVTLERRILFMDYVDKSLDRCIKMGFNSIERFELCFMPALYAFSDPPSRVSQWLRKLFDIGVKTMHLEIGLGYKLLDLVLNSHTLVELHLNCLGFIRSCITINLPKLKSLSLFEVDLDKGSLKMLVDGCPKIDVLTIVRCFIEKNLQISCLAKLLKLKMSYCIGVEVIEIGSLKFQSLSLLGENEHNVELLGVNETMRRLEVNKSMISTKFSAFKFLEELKLKNLCIKDRISSQSVKKLFIKVCEVETKLVEIDCPNLLFLDYFYNQKPFCFVCECNPREFKYEFPLEKGSERQEQIRALGNLFANTYYKDTKSLKVIISISNLALEEIIILEGLFELMLHILNEEERSDSILIAHNIDWYDICYDPNLNDVAINLVSSSKSRFSKDVWEELLRLQKSKNGWQRNLCSVEIDYEEENVPTILLQEHQGSQYELTRILLKFDWTKFEEPL